MKYRAEIDGLRALAVVPVILFHAGFELFSGGFVGVDVFFVISGYLITTILIEDIEKNRFSFVNFYERRARRILPALFFVIFICIPFAWMWMLPSQMKDFSQSLIAVSFFASNILFWRESGYFDAAAEEKPLLHTWSLAVEEQYYVLFPIFLFFAWRYGKNKVFWMIVVFAVLSLALSEWGWRNKATANFYLAPTRAWELFAGSIAAFVVQNRGVQSNNALSLLGLAAIVFAIFAYDEATPFPSMYALVPVAGVVLLVLFADRETLAAKLLSKKIVVGIGLVSYSAYLWHQPLFAFARIKLIETPSFELMAILSLMSIILAWFSWKFVETPFRNKLRFNRNKIFFLSIVLSSLIFGFGLVGNTTNGYVSQRNFLPFIQKEIEIKAIYEQRQTAIRAGICHFNGRGKFQKIDVFLENWKCINHDDELLAGNVMIIGDSHSADKALSLRLNGIDVYQIGGAGCQLVPSYISEERNFCKSILRFAKSLVINDELTAVFLSNRFRERELSESYLVAIFDYWKGVDAKVYLWSPMPNFKRQLDAYLGGRKGNFLPSYSREKLFFSILNRIEVPDNFIIVKTSSYWCPEGSNDKVCSSFSDTGILMADEDHLGVDGATIFGKRIIGSEIFKFLSESE